MADRASPLTIISATPEHIELIVPLFDQYRQFYAQPSDLAAARQFVWERLTKQDSILFLALQAAVGVGFTQLYPSFSSVAMKRLWILNDLFVAPAARKHGIAAALLEHARQFAIATQAKGLVLETAFDNLPAQRLYEQQGWRKDEEFYRYYLNV